MPRFQVENLEHNKKLYERGQCHCFKEELYSITASVGLGPYQGNDVCPITSTTKIGNLNQNIGALSVKLSAEDMAELESIASARVKGDRYDPGRIKGRGYGI